MIAYIDSSVLLRIALDAPGPLAEWNEIKVPLSSELLEVECHRTLDRLWHQGQLTDADFRLKRREIELILGRFTFLPLRNHVLTIAAAPLPVSLASLDAIHLSTALIDGVTRDFVFATHDKALAKAARAMRLDVIGA